MKQWFGALALTAAIAFAVPATAQTNLSIVTGGTGGVYYPLGGGLANLLTKHVPGYAATAEVTGGSVDNLKLIGAGKAQLGLAMADATLDAFKGEDKFKGAKVEIRTLMVAYANKMHVVTVEGTGIEKMSDLKGKRVSTGSPGSATEVMAFRLIEAAGLDKDKDMKRERLGVAESTNAIKDRKIDAYFWVGGLPTAGVTDLAATPGTKIKLVDHAEYVGKMNDKHGKLYAAGVIPQSTYPGMAKDNTNVDVWNLLVANANLPEAIVENVLKIMFDRRADMIAVHKEAENFDLKYQKAANSPVPFHPGAIKFFAARGVKID
jgi:TRAP transporter TAXI family solute receptor